MKLGRKTTWSISTTVVIGFIIVAIFMLVILWNAI